MARLPRLALAGHTHLVLQCAHAGLATALFEDELDRQAYSAALFAAAAEERVVVYAYALCEREVRLLLNPASAAGLSRLMQALGRRYVSAHHRRHGGQGTLWEGRYRAALVEPGDWRLAALRWVDAADTPPTDLPAAAGHPDPRASGSARQRLGGRREPGLVDPPEWWPLGNTPFEREAAYRQLLCQAMPATQAHALRHAALGGWALGSAAYVGQVAQALGRPATPRPRGRPRKRAGLPANGAAGNDDALA